MRKNPPSGRDDPEDRSSGEQKGGLAEDRTAFGERGTNEGSNNARGAPDAGDSPLVLT